MAVYETVLATIRGSKAFPVLAADGSTFTGKDAGVTPTEGSSWEIGTFLQEFAKNLSNWAGPIMVVLGFAALIAGAYMLVTGLISHGKKQTSWPIVILLFVVGGALAVGGWQFVAGNLAAGLNDTVSNWGSGAEFVLPLL